MATDAETGHGSEFWLDDENSTLFELGEITDVPVPDGEAALIDASHHKTVGFKDYIQAPLQEGEEADLVMNWIPNSDTDAVCRGAVGQRRDFRINCPAEGGVYRFEGTVLVRKYTRQNPREEKRVGTLKVKWVSEVTETFIPA